MRELSHEKRKLSKRWVIHRIRHKRVQFIKRPIVLLYKGYKSSVNYDGEPSVSKGIGSQLVR